MTADDRQAKELGPVESVELSVIVPCLNEELNVPELGRRVLGAFDAGELAGELVLVDDGSRDGTAQAIRALMAAHPGRVTGAFHLQNRGVAAAWKSGAEAARGRLVATIDADLQYQPEDLLRLRRALHEHSVDVVQGYRSTIGRAKDKRYHISRAFNFMLNSAFGMDLEDNKSGMVMCAREVLLDLLSYEGNYFYWQSFIMVAAHAKGYSVKQVEALFEPRKAGQSFLDEQTVSASVKSVFDLGRALVEYRNPGPPDVAKQFLRRHPVVDRTPGRDPFSAARFRVYMAAFNRTHWMITRDVEHYYETLCKTQWLAASELRELQDEKLRRLVRHAYRNVPYYRRKMQALGLHPEDIRGQADLAKLPLLSKAEVQQHLHFDIMSENHDKAQVLRVSTSGSTGEPFVCYADRAQLEFRWAATLRSQEWTGYRFGDPSVRLWHQTIGLSARQAARERADAELSNRTLVPVFELTDHNLEKTLRQMAQVKPVLMDGYAEAFHLLAEWALAHDYTGVRPRAIQSSAQMLTRPSRARIEEAFGCRVFDKYGSREFSGVAYECEAHAGHHVVAEGYVVELLTHGEPTRPGEVGEVVITDLNNYCMPFIRYRIGDLAEAMTDAPCACGRGAPRIGDVQGRVQSIIQGADGQYVPGTFFEHFLKEYGYAIQRFQVIQERPRHMTFRVVKAGRYSDEVEREVLAGFRDVLGEKMQIDVELVDAIALVPTGKHVATLSKLPIDFQSHGGKLVRGA